MIEAELDREAGVLTVEPRGRLEDTDFERLRLLVDPYIEQQGPLRGVLIFSPDFPGWEDFGAMLSQLRFIDNHQEKVARVAAVGDSVLMSLLPRLADWFVDAEVRGFDYNERDIAEGWLYDTGRAAPRR